MAGESGDVNYVIAINKSTLMLLAMAVSLALAYFFYGEWARLVPDELEED